MLADADNPQGADADTLIPHTTAQAPCRTVRRDIVDSLLVRYRHVRYIGIR